jgi:hypothetical protein
MVQLLVKANSSVLVAVQENQLKKFLPLVFVIWIPQTFNSDFLMRFGRRERTSHSKQNENNDWAADFAQASVPPRAQLPSIKCIVQKVAQD